MNAMVMMLALFGCLLLNRTSIAQVAQPPPHAPGSICYTPQFWCWAQPPGLLGSPCACPTPYGWVSGVRG
jgi:hypothetical protein